MRKKIRVLIVDDSAVVRQTLSDILSSGPDLEVMAAVADPFMAARRLRAELPDVITLDIEMPRMDGITFLQKIMRRHPMPVVICSSMAASGSENAMQAIANGAVEIIEKPKVGTREFLKESSIRIRDAVRAAALAKVKHLPAPLTVEKKLTADAVIENAAIPRTIQTTDKIVMVGASTGGTEALRVLLMALPQDAPGTVIVQHMPEHFTRAFSQRLDSLCRVEVKEAEDGDRVLRGRVLIAPGNRHTLLKRSGARYYVEVKDGPLVCRHRPSVDVLFRSAARYAGANAVGVLMTGMGDDGARGMLEMKAAGAYTIAQDKATSVIFGMAQEAIKLGGVDKVRPLDRIAGTVLRRCAA